MPPPRQPSKITDLRSPERVKGPPLLFRAPFPPGRHGKRITDSLGPPPVRVRRDPVRRRGLPLRHVITAAIGGAIGAVMVGSGAVIGAWVTLGFASPQSPATSSIGVFTVEDD